MLTANAWWRLPPAWKRRLPTVVTILVGVAFSVSVSSLVRWWEFRDIEKAFHIAAEDRSNAIKGTFETEVAMLELIRTGLMTDGRVERDEFRDLLTPFLRRSRSIMAVEWIPRVLGNQRAEFEAAARRDGFPEFAITELSKAGQLIHADDRREYYPIYYIGPKPGDKSLYGFDCGSEATRLDALRLARDTGRAVASGRITLVQETQKRDGFLVYLPAYEKGTRTDSVAARRANLWGFVLGVFRPEEMLAAATAKFQPEGIDVCLHDPLASETDRPFMLHRSRVRRESWGADDQRRLAEPSGLSVRCRLDVAGHPWTIVCLATPDFVAARKTWSPWSVLGAGLVLTAILAAYVSSSIARRATAEELLTEKRRYAGELEQKVRAQTGHIRRAQEEIIHRLLSASQWRDEETGMHVRRVGLLSEALAKAAGWPVTQCDCIRQAAPMHDVGKIGVPDAILRKPDKLTPDEFEVMKTHTLIGGEMLAGSSVPLLQMAREIALNHHERWDGQGYPNGWAAQDIPESARIVAIVDVYDALTHDRVYRPAMSEDEALAVLREGAGTQFDPLLVAHFFLHHSEIRRIADQYPDEASAAAPQGATPVWSGVAPIEAIAAP
ncbi:MAG: CHASE domain-containing protein [Thermoguttaceae bacterium]